MNKLFLSALATVALAAMVGGVYAQSPFYGEAGGGASLPSSSTDNAIVRWDGTSGGVLQNSSATVSDTGTLSTATVTVTATNPAITVPVAGRVKTASYGGLILGLGTTNGRHALGNSAETSLLQFDVQAGNPRFIVGTGSPETVETAAVGSVFLRTDGGASTTLYIKESGSGNTGWVAK